MVILYPVYISANQMIAALQTGGEALIIFLNI